MNTTTTTAISEAVKLLSSTDQINEIKEDITGGNDTSLVLKAADIVTDLAIIGTSIASVSNPELAVVSQLLTLAKSLVEKKIAENTAATSTEADKQETEKE